MLDTVGVNVLVAFVGGSDVVVVLCVISKFTVTCLVVYCVLFFSFVVAVVVTNICLVFFFSSPADKIQNYFSQFHIRFSRFQNCLFLEFHVVWSERAFLMVWFFFLIFYSSLLQTKNYILKIRITLAL